MAIELISRPIGHKLGTVDVDANIYDDGTEYAIVYTGTGHGLSDGDYVFIDSDFDRYNGYFLVDSTAYDYFKIKVGTEYVEYIQDAEISLRISSLDHGFQCVHLPIVYELQSDLWPNNVAEEAYTPVVINSFENVNGYTKLNLSAAISGLTDLNFIELVGGELAGSYQIIDAVQPWAIVINLSYNVSNSFSGVQVVNYYNNYAINVNVYAGYTAGHRWNSIKPYELAATLKLIPDSNGKVKFSIAEILKGYINTRNNLTLDTLPNNTDFSVGFYIEYFETYDESDGTEITTFTGDVTTDTFEGTAINAMLPFKSIDSGFMSEYVSNDGTAQWLTLVARPIAFIGRFFDLSFINPLSGSDIVVSILKYPGAVLEEVTIYNPGSGVIRVPLDPESGYSEYCVRARTGPISQPPVPALNQWTQVSGGSNSWSLGSNPSYFATGANISNILRAAYPFMAGYSYEFNYNFDNSGFPELMEIGTYDGFSSMLSESVTIAISSNGNKFGTITLTPTVSQPYIGIRLTGSPSSITLDINSFVSSGSTLDGFNITETICIDVIDECSPTFIDDDLRITDDSLPRII